MHVVIVSVEIKPETREEFLRVVALDAEGTRSEPSCLGFEVLNDKVLSSK